MDPPGFIASIFTHTSAEPGSTMRRSCTSGVLPMNESIMDAGRVGCGIVSGCVRNADMGRARNLARAGPAAPVGPGAPRAPIRAFGIRSWLLLHLEHKFGAFVELGPEGRRPHPARGFRA